MENLNGHLDEGCLALDVFVLRSPWLDLFALCITPREQRKRTLISPDCWGFLSTEPMMERILQSDMA